VIASTGWAMSPPVVASQKHPSATQVAGRSESENRAASQVAHRASAVRARVTAAVNAIRRGSVARVSAMATSVYPSSSRVMYTLCGSSV